MNVLVYPEVNCKHENGRWYLLPPSEEAPPATELTGEPRRVVEQITEEIPRQDGEFHIPGFLWNRHDSHITVCET